MAHIPRALGELVTNPLLDSYWRNEHGYLWDAIEPVTMRALLAGAEGAAALLPAEIAPLVDFDFFNRAALRYLGQYRLSTVAAINETTRHQAIEAINEWMRSGQELEMLKVKLRPIFGETRADSIAVTEVTRTVAEGNMQLWGSTGVVSGKRWMTAVTDVCPVCAPLHGAIVELEGNFTHGPDALANEALQKALAHLGSAFRAPPAHPRCRCWLQPVVSEDLLRQEIGDILAGQFFARVRAGEVDAFIAASRTMATPRSLAR